MNLSTIDAKYGNRPHYYDPDGKPYTGTFQEQILKWSVDFHDPNKHVVAQEYVGWFVFVSTVWLGMDHGFGSSKPMIYETIIFFRVLYSGLFQHRYSTKADALAGHYKTVNEVRRQLCKFVFSFAYALMKYGLELTWLGLKHIISKIYSWVRRGIEFHRRKTPSRYRLRHLWKRPLLSLLHWWRQSIRHQ